MHIKLHLENICKGIPLYGKSVDAKSLARA